MSVNTTGSSVAAASLSAAAPTQVLDTMKDFIDKWKPSLTEVILYVVVLFVIYLFGALMYYNNIQMRVKRESACYRDKTSATQNGVFYATATNQNRDPLYKVGYNFGAKTFSVDCACTEGSVANTFPSVDVFNLSTQQVQTIDSQMCSCEKQLYNPTTDTIYFTGYPGVVRFMNTASLYSGSDKQKLSDTTFFDTALNGPSS